MTTAEVVWIAIAFAVIAGFLLGFWVHGLLCGRNERDYINLKGRKEW